MTKNKMAQALVAMRWKKTTKEERSKEMSRVAKMRYRHTWKSMKKDKKDEAVASARRALALGGLKTLEKRGNG